MRISFVCSSGSPIGLIPEDIGGKGVGGAELAMMTFAEVLAKRGHTVSVYNNPVVVGVHGGVSYQPVGAWSPADDVTIIFRTPFPRGKESKGRKVFWSCDQYTEGNYDDIIRMVDKVVLISDFHRKYFDDNYKGHQKKTEVIPLGVRTWEYDESPEKDPNGVIFCSVPNRGLDVFLPLWKRIQKQVPEVNLTITSDFRLWGVPEPRNEYYRTLWYKAHNVQFLGKVPRAELVQHQLKASLMLYPCTYDELFCISCAECQVAGALPITSGVGALSTTNMFGVVIPGVPGTPTFSDFFVDMSVDILKHRSELYQTSEIIRAARLSFDWNTIAGFWESEVFGCAS